MFNAYNPFNQVKYYDFNYQVWKHKQEYGYNQMTPLPELRTTAPQVTPTPLRTEEERQNYIYNLGSCKRR